MSTQDQQRNAPSSSLQSAYLQSAITSLGEPWTMLALGLRAARHALQEGRYREASSTLEAASVKVARRFPDRVDLLEKVEEVRVIACSYAEDAAALTTACADLVAAPTKTSALRTLPGLLALGDELLAAKKVVGAAALGRCAATLLGASAETAYLCARLLHAHVSAMIEAAAPVRLRLRVAEEANQAYRRAIALGGEREAGIAGLRRAGLAQELAEAAGGSVESSDAGRGNPFLYPPALQLTYARLHVHSARRMRRVRALDLLASLADEPNTRDAALALVRWWLRTLPSHLDPMERDRLEGALRQLPAEQAPAARGFLEASEAYSALREGALAPEAWAARLEQDSKDPEVQRMTAADRGAYDAVVAWLAGESVPSPLLRGALQPAGAGLKALSVARDPTGAGAQAVLEAYERLGWQQADALRPLAALLPVLLSRWGSEDEPMDADQRLLRDATSSLVRSYASQAPAPPYGLLGLAELCGRVGEDGLAARCALRAARDGTLQDKTLEHGLEHGLDDATLERASGWLLAGAVAAATRDDVAESRELLLAWRSVVQG